MAHNRLIRAVATIPLALAPLLAACDPPLPETGGATALVIGYHKNAPQPAIVGSVNERLRTAITRGDNLVIISVTGSSKVVASDSMACPYSNEPACRTFRNDIVRQIAGTVTKYPADREQADLIGALNLARDSLSSAKGPKQIIVIDNGLSTAGPLILKTFEDLDGNPDDLARQYAAKGILHSLAGYSLTFSGLGQTGDDQRLPEPYPAKVQNLWKTMATSAGAQDVNLDLTPLPARPSSVSLPSVTVVGPPKKGPTDVVCDSPQALRADQLGFVADEATIRNPKSAKALLTSLAQEMRKKTALTVVLTGTTAYDDGGGRALSEARAAAVKEILVDLGVDDARILTQGVGIDWDGYIPPGGNPQKERDMRLVLIKVNCPGQ